jgi:hypothetical protein
MSYNEGSVVVFSAFGKFKVGKVTEKILSKRGYRYTILSEDGKIYSNVMVNSTSSDMYISKNLTESFNTSTDNG